MRTAIVMLIFMLYESVTAASARWSGIIFTHGGNYDDNVTGYVLGGSVNGAHLNSHLFGHEKNGMFYLKHMDFSGESLNPTFCWWTLALYGDVVGEKAFNTDSTKYIEDFYGNDPSMLSIGGTLVEDADDFYLAFKVSEVLIDDNYDYVPGQTWYGWVHVSIDENLEMTLLGDGINLDGGAVMVGYGATPEPASGVLLLLGGALLALRRRRSGITPCSSCTRRRASSRC